MTNNQINYWNLKETNRSNLEKERQGRDVIAETGRHNRATEAIDLGKLEETQRHNRVTESQTDRSLSETERSNKVREQLAGLEYAEKVRSNQAQEALRGVDLNINRDKVDEEIRHNLAYERLQSTDLNIKDASQKENARHNVASEALAWNELNLKQAEAEVRASTAKVENMYTKAKKDYQEIINEKASLVQTLGVRETQLKLDNLKAINDKIETEIKKLGSDMSYTEWKKTLDTITTLSDTAQKVSTEIRKWTTGGF